MFSFLQTVSHHPAEVTSVAQLERDHNPGRRPRAGPPGKHPDCPLFAADVRGPLSAQPEHPQRTAQ